MKEKARTTTGFFVFLALLGLSSVAVGDSYEYDPENPPKIIDYWIGGEKYGQENFEFFEDNTCLAQARGKGTAPCTWVLLSDGRIKLTISQMGLTAVTFAEVSGDQLTIWDVKDEPNYFVRRGSERDITWRNEQDSGS